MKKLLLVSVLLLTSCSQKEMKVTDDTSVEEKTTEKSIEKVSEKVVKPKKKAPLYSRKEIKGVTYINGLIIVNKKISLPSTYNPGENKTVRKILNHMIQDAKNEHMHLVIRSGYRSYAAQEKLYEKFVAIDGQQIAESYSARPGQSEHQTGLAYDIGSVESTANTSIQFGQTQEGKWLEKNAHKYGFIIRYGKNQSHITGYQYEPWHIRYVGKKHALNLFKSGKTLEEYLGVYKKPTIKKRVIKHPVVTEESLTTETPVISEHPVTTEEKGIIPEVSTEEPTSISPITTEQPFVNTEEIHNTILETTE
ncbi:D-alanyl-D-alanine carboxypeptidase family protein [Macrococcus sp. EM39E]|uniref:M15 family metallopeptidase n=1 Tax=Macrococcus animalis TaxID=3395467 RepID=UPI0039BDF0A7